MKKYVVLEKPVGQTPLEAITTWKETHPEYQHVPASYAGRLDPMASGKLLVLLGEECKKQKMYTGLDKAYEVEILLDVGSDTGDVLGITSYASRETRVDEHTLTKILRREEGTHERAYPIYSSKTVAGKPLFLYALSGTLDTISIPTHPETIYRVNLLHTKEISAKELRHHIDTALTKVPLSTEPSKALGADFRIREVEKTWEKVFAESGERTFHIIHAQIICGSGTYMRSLAGRIGESLGTKGLALSINRTHIGIYRFGIWWRTFR